MSFSRFVSQSPRLSYIMAECLQWVMGWEADICFPRVGL